MSEHKNNLEWFERGSKWRKWDLHLHSPKSYDYKNKSITAEKMIMELKKNNISAAAITDHNIIDVEFMEELVKIGYENEILILPGIEFVSSYGGKEAVHFLGIFNNNNINRIWNNLNIKLNIEDEISEKKDEGVYFELKDACNLIHELDGITCIHAGNKHNSIENIKNGFPLEKV